MPELELLPVVYYGPEHTCTMHITSSPLVFPKGEPVLVVPAVRDSLLSLTDNQGQPYGWFANYLAPPDPPAEVPPDAPPVEEPTPPDPPDAPDPPADGDVSNDAAPKATKKKET